MRGTRKLLAAVNAGGRTRERRRKNKKKFKVNKQKKKKLSARREEEGNEDEDRVRHVPEARASVIIRKRAGCPRGSRPAASRLESVCAYRFVTLVTY